MQPSAPDLRDQGQAFPRFAVADLVADDERALRRRTLAQAAVLGVALALIALALPTERLVGRGSALVTTLGDGSLVDQLAFGATAPLARALALATEWSLERSAYLVAAVLWALTLPFLVGLAMRAGARPLVALALATAGALSPIGWSAATLPSPEAAGLLGATLVIRAMFAPRLGWTSFAQVALALALDPLNALLFPAVAIRLACDRTFKGLGNYAFFGAVAVAAALGALLVGRTTDAELVAPSRAISWTVLALTLAACALLLRRPRVVEESRPPAWLALIPVGAIVGIAVPTFGPAAAPALVPLLVLALGYAAGQCDAAWTRVALPACALSFGLTIAAELALSSTDPDRAWLARARSLLEPDDLYVTGSRRRAYLLEHRFGLATVDLSTVRAEELEAAARATVDRGGRVIHEGGHDRFGSDLAEALVAGGAIHLDEL